MPQRQVSRDRKTLYYVGMVVSIVGLLSFLSTFFSAIANFGDFSDFDSDVKSMGFRAFGGMVLIVAGGVMMTLGRAGAAGSGLKLDPEQMRRDLEPWNRASGGMLKDTLDEAGIDVGKIAAGLAGPSEAAAGEPLEVRLRGLHALFKEGILTEEEYLREKQELLDRE